MLEKAIRDLEKTVAVCKFGNCFGVYISHINRECKKRVTNACFPFFAKYNYSKATNYGQPGG